MTTYYLELAW